MSSITAADLKLGGRLTAACEAVGAGHLNRAAGIFAEIADDLNQEATANIEDGPAIEEDWSSPMPAKPAAPVTPAVVATADLQMCSRGVHAFGAADPVSGWRVCASCGQVNIAPPGGGPIDMGARQ